MSLEAVNLLPIERYLLFRRIEEKNKCSLMKRFFIVEQLVSINEEKRSDLENLIHFSLFRNEKSPNASSSDNKSTTSHQNNSSNQSKSHVTSTGDKQHTDLDKIEVKLEKKSDVGQQNQKHSSNTSGFSLKNPVSSFRSWVSQKKLPKEDSTRLNHSTTTYGKIDTSPTPRKSSSDFDNVKRSRTNSASASNAPSVIHNHHQDVPTNSSTTTTTTTTRVKKKSSFALRNTNPIALLKRTTETNHQTGVNASNNEQTGNTGGGGGGGGGAFGYLKNLVRGDSSGSEKKQ